MCYLSIYQVLMCKPQMHNSIQCACFVIVILQWMRRFRGLPHTPTLPTCFFPSYGHPHQCGTFIWGISQLYGQSTLPTVHSWKNLVHGFGPIYRSVSTVMLLYRYFHSRSSIFWPLTDFFSLCPWCRMVFSMELCLLQTSLVIASLHLLFTWGDSENWGWEWFLLTGLDGYSGRS